MGINEATANDLAAVNHILNWHSENGFSTFMETTSLEERRKWFDRFDGKRHILLLAKDDERVVGLAGSFAYRNGGVFSRTLETTVYIHPEYMGQGIGTTLYNQLFERLSSCSDVHRVVVGIALPNEGSIALHRRFGFEEIGIFDEYAFYKGSYRSSVWMQKKMDGAKTFTDSVSRRHPIRGPVE